MSGSRVVAVVLFVLGLSLAMGDAFAQGNANWWEGFHPPGVKKSGYDGKVNVVVSRGENVYIGGDFDQVGLVDADNIARWDGHRWHALGEGVNGEVFAMYAAVEALFVSGQFSEAGGEPAAWVAEWSDGIWHRMGDDDFDAPVHCFEYHGASLYAGGSFTQYGASQMWHLARWNMVEWQQAETHGPYCYVCFPSEIRALKHFNGKLWVGGRFDTIDGTHIYNIATWDEESGYEVVGTGGGAVGGMGNVVTCFEVQPATIYFGGEFLFADWEDCLGLGWASSGEHLYGVTPFQPDDYWVRDLLDYSGNLLVVSDKWLRTRGGGVWGGSLGSMRGAGCAHVEGNYVYAGGELIGESSHTDGLARWDGSEWSRVGAGMAFRHDYGDLVQTVTSYDGDLFIGGKNTGARSVSYQEDDCYGTVLYDGGDILPMAPGLDPTFTSLVYQGDLYVGGEFNPSGLGLSRIARRGPAGWEALGAGVSQSAFSGAVYDLTEWQEKLILGGKFSQADGLTCDNLVAWDGAAFSLVDDADFSSDILAVCGFAGDLVVGGKFTSIDGAPMGRIARWDGLSWTNMNGGFDDYVECLEVWDGELYAGGRFSSADGVGTARVARWDGAAWQPLGMGMDGAEGVMALQDSDVGLFAGGDFTTAGGTPAAGVARWTGAAWEALGDGVTGGPIQPIVRDFCVHEGNLYLVGTFLYAGGKLSSCIARWTEQMTPVTLNSFDLTSEPGTVEIRWEIAESASPELRLEARLGDARWVPAFFEEASGSYRCSDRSPLLIGGGRVEYLLRGREAGEDWTLLRRADIEVEPIAAALRPAITVWPNPANPHFTIELSMPASASVLVSIVDVSGRRLAILHEGPLAAGEHSMSWSGQDDVGRELASGVYLLSLQGPAGISSRRLVLLR